MSEKSSQYPKQKVIRTAEEIINDHMKVKTEDMRSSSRLVHSAVISSLCMLSMKNLLHLKSSLSKEVAS